MSIIYNPYFVNICTAIVTFIFSFTFAYIIHQIKYKRENWIIKDFFKKDIRIVVAQHDDFCDYESSGLIGVGCFNALLELQKKAYKQKEIQDNILFFNDLDKDKDIKSNLIIIGGPDVNPLTLNFLKTVNSNIIYRDNNEHIISCFDKLDNRFLYPNMDNVKGCGSDYGIVIKAKNPINNNSNILIIFGGYGYGTWGAMRYALSKEIKKEIKKIESNSFECVLRIDVMYKKIQTVKIERLTKI